MIMAGQILVPFNSHFRVEDIISVIEEAAKPGMRVVFLVRYPVDPWVWFRDHWVTTESSRNAMLAGGKVMEKYSWEGQRALAEEMVAPWGYVFKRWESRRPWLFIPAVCQACWKIIVAGTRSLS
jgi:hypothetical protein